MEDQWLIAAIYYIVKSAYFLYTQCVGVPVYVTFHILLLPLRFVRPRLFWTIDAHLFKAVLGGVTSWFYTDGVVLKESGDSLKDILDDKALLLCNHQSTADIGVIMQSLHPKGMVTGHMTWVMDHVFRLTHFGWVSHLHGDFFLKQPCRTVSERTKQMKKLKTHLKNIYLKTLKKWIVVFPEGGFLSTRKPGNQRYAKKHGLPVLENVCLPRLGVTKTILDELAPKEGLYDFNDNHEKLNWIIDMTIAYPRGEAPNALTLMFSMGKFPPIHIHFRVFDIQSVPRDENGLTKWMYDRYVEKEAMLDHFYKTGMLANDGMETQDTDKISCFLYVLFYSIWMWWLFIFVYTPIFSLFSWKLIFGIIFCYVLYFIYDFIKYFRDFSP
ncbi:acyl-CoA:lysophosphatidylglycerol acyltransferase 1-like [Saccostrea echinata]|uniref:acyl-CoA:lysophosphatidylglycerol acyltransferase 1-like n=1 Tax=Saccostrea echinata TaxID=191078 RepID=UPI002A82ECB6|nr:acyl-CoA:lysophosphatidylglycerol acyltransferase 1-like [Saccostrea echinata]